MASAKQKKREKHSLSDLKKLGHQLLTSRAHINNLPLLITYVTPSTPSQYVLESLLSLESFFITVLPELPHSSISRGTLSSCKAEVDAEVVYRTWLRLKFDELINSLMEIAISTCCDETLREVALDTFMEFVKLGHGGSFYSAIYHKLLHKIVCSDLAVEYLLEVLASKYFKYIDVRYFTYISMDKIAKILETRSNSGDASDKIQPEASLAYSINKIHFIISHIPPLGSPEKTDEYENWSESGIKEGTKDLKAVKDKNKHLPMEKSNKNGFPSSSKMRVKFTKAWMSFLRLPLPLDVYKEVLVYLHQTVIPYLSNPVMLCDFLTRSYDIGGVVSVMALSSLYILMTQHGLEYPNFYEKLYALLVPSVFMAKHRAKFFELLDSCLKSPLLPAYLAAAFAKKLSRLALAVPPSGELIITALVYNLLRRHPSINCLIHQDGNANSQEDTSAVVESIETEKDNDSSIDKPKQGVDLFKIDECDPLKSNALGSSLWELDTLRHHYCPPVSRFVETLKEDLTNKRKTTEINIKDFSSASYSTIFREEMRRRVKQVPLEFYNKIPSSLFSESDFPQWSFKFEGCEQGNTIDDQNCLLVAPEDCNGNSVK